MVNDTAKEEDAVDEAVPEYRVRRTANGEWEPATEQEAAESRAHDRAVAEEEAAQEARNRENFQVMEASLQQRWDDWAMQTEMERENPMPSRKRVKVVMTVGTASGGELGEAHVVGAMEAGPTPVVSFKVEETILGGVDGKTAADFGLAAVAMHAQPQLADFDPEGLPGLSPELVDIMTTTEAKHWLNLFAQGLASRNQIEERFGVAIHEVFDLWLAIRDDARRPQHSTVVN